MNLRPLNAAASSSSTRTILIWSYPTIRESVVPIPFDAHRIIRFDHEAASDVGMSDVLSDLDSEVSEA
jgi:hypothetical protein